MRNQQSTWYKATFDIIRFGKITKDYVLGLDIQGVTDAIAEKTPVASVATNIEFFVCSNQYPLGKKYVKE